MSELLSSEESAALWSDLGAIGVSCDCDVTSAFSRSSSFAVGVDMPRVVEDGDVENVVVCFSVAVMPGMMTLRMVCRRIVLRR